MVSLLVLPYFAPCQDITRQVRLHVHARLDPVEDVGVGLADREWEERVQRVVRNGQPVSLRLEKPRLHILLRIIPYLVEESQVLAVLQTEARRLTEDGRTSGIFSNVQTVHLAFDEPVLFLPFGKRGATHVLAIQILVQRE